MKFFNVSFFSLLVQRKSDSVQNKRNYRGHQSSSPEAQRRAQRGAMDRGRAVPDRQMDKNRDREKERDRLPAREKGREREREKEKPPVVGLRGSKG